MAHIESIARRHGVSTVLVSLGAGLRLRRTSCNASHDDADLRRVCGTCGLVASRWLRSGYLARPDHSRRSAARRYSSDHCARCKEHLHRLYLVALGARTYPKRLIEFTTNKADEFLRVNTAVVVDDMSARINNNHSGCATGTVIAHHSQ